MASDHLVPMDKHDLAAAARAAAAGWPAVEPVIGELLEWVQDINWPVAGPLAEFLAGIGTPLVVHLQPILDGDDPIWKSWVVACIVGSADVEVRTQLAPTLRRLAERPTPRELEEDVAEYAADVLGTLQRR